MNYMKFKQQLEDLKNVYESICESVDLVLEDPASEAEIIRVEKQIGKILPGEIKDFFRKFSRNCEFSAYLPSDLELPEELSEVFSACFRIGLEEVAAAEEARMNWQTECFTNKQDEYDRVWYDKLGIMTVGNGDVIALDIGIDKENPPVVYLSHDDGEGHGYILGNTFAGYLEALLSVGACGNEDWQMIPFCEDRMSGIDPRCKNAEAYREIIGLPWT